MSDNIFRKTALDRLSSPEQLDRLMTVTSPQSWLALLAVLAIVAATVVWSLFGSLPTRVEGQGILINSTGRVVDVQATGSGTLSEILVTVGDEVEAGQIVARLALTDAEQAVRSAEAVVRESEARLKRTVAQGVSERDARRRSAERRRKALAGRLEAARHRLQYLAGRRDDLAGLLENGVITRQIAAQARDEATRAELEAADVQSELLVLDSEVLEREIAIENRRRQAEEELAEARRTLDRLTASLTRSAVVTAPAGGRVTEIKAVPGSLVSEGRSLFTFQSGKPFLELRLYVPARQGKRVSPGMSVQVSPWTARREEYGTVSGTVDWISEFPATLDGMRAVLQNDELARTFAQSGPPYVARILLDRDPETASGYRWSSAQGAKLPLTGGTLASGEITVSRQAPISLVIPLLRELGGFSG